jgi:hypothetical protein
MGSLAAGAGMSAAARAADGGGGRVGAGAGGIAGLGGAGPAGLAGSGGVAGSSGVAGVGGASGAGGGSGSATAGQGGGSCDSCSTLKAGVKLGCKTRFMFGVNYAWINFGEDFGGGNSGVAANQPAVRSALKDMKTNGVDVVRWWMHPTFFAPGVTFDGSGNATGIAGSEVADIDAALALAAEADVYIKLTLFSFDNFRGDDRAGHGLTAIISDTAKRQALIDHVVRPIAHAVAASPNAARMISWDVINEPEWAISGEDGRGDQAFDANPELMAVPFATMESFVGDVVKGLRQESAASITVGQAAIKWAHAFTKVGLDYYDMHYYGWVDQYFPLGGKSLADYGLADKPVVVGEFPLDGWNNPNGTLNANQIVSKLFDLGYAGAKAWAFTADGNWSGNKSQLASFAAAKGCAVVY